MTVRPVAARLLYVAVVLFATIAELRASRDVAAAGRRLARALHPSVTARDVVDGLRNVLLFAGFGATWAATAARRRWWRWALPATASGFVLSACVETAQLFSPVRTASVIDVATNTAGTLAGAWITAAAIGAAARRVGARSYLGVPALALAVPYALAAFAEAASPLFRNRPVPGAWGGPARRLAVALAASRGAASGAGALDVLLFVPAGALLVMALAELGVGLGSAALVASLAGVVGAAAAEGARGLSGQPLDPVAGAAHAAGVAIGAVLAWRGLPHATRRLRRGRRAAAFWGVYAAALLLWVWRPFRLDLSATTRSAELTAAHLVPLYALGERGDLFSVADVAIQFALFVPLGVLAAVWPFRRRGPVLLRGPVPAVALGLVLELGQLVIADRFFDVTDWLIGGAGVLVGWAVARRAGYQSVGELLAP